MNNNFWLHCATLGPIGYFKMPGTLATLVTLPLVYAAKQYSSEMEYLAVVAILFVACSIIVSKALTVVQRSDDPQYIVLDELVGCFVTFSFVAMSWKTAVVGFLLFRFFDITKFPPVRYAELLFGWIGIMGDDIIAGLMANVVLYLMNTYMFEPSLLLLGLW